MHQIGFSNNVNLVFMNNVDGLDRWINKTEKQRKTNFSKSLFPHEEIALHSLKERIAELEQIRDQILYELDKLKALDKFVDCQTF